MSRSPFIPLLAVCLTLQGAASATSQELFAVYPSAVDGSVKLGGGFGGREQPLAYLLVGGGLTFWPSDRFGVGVSADVLTTPAEGEGDLVFLDLSLRARPWVRSAAVPDLVGALYLFGGVGVRGYSLGEMLVDSGGTVDPVRKESYSTQLTFGTGLDLVQYDNGFGLFAEAGAHLHSGNYLDDEGPVVTPSFLVGVRWRRPPSQHDGLPPVARPPDVPPADGAPGEPGGQPLRGPAAAPVEQPPTARGADAARERPNGRIIVRPIRRGEIYVVPQSDVIINARVLCELRPDASNQYWQGNAEPEQPPLVWSGQPGAYVVVVRDQDREKQNVVRLAARRTARMPFDMSENTTLPCRS